MEHFMYTGDSVQYGSLSACHLYQRPVLSYRFNPLTRTANLVALTGTPLYSGEQMTPVYSYGPSVNALQRYEYGGVLPSSGESMDPAGPEYQQREGQHSVGQYETERKQPVSGCYLEKDVGSNGSSPLYPVQQMAPVYPYVPSMSTREIGLRRFEYSGGLRSSAESLDQSSQEYQQREVSALSADFWGDADNECLEDVTNEIFRKFIKILAREGPLNPTHEKLLNIFTQLSTYERKIVMAHGSIKSFLSKSNMIQVYENMLHVRPSHAETPETETDSIPASICSEPPEDDMGQQRGSRSHSETSRSTSETSHEEEEFAARAVSCGITVSHDVDVVSERDYDSAEEEDGFGAVCEDEEADAGWNCSWSKDSDADTVQELLSPSESFHSCEQEDGPPLEAGNLSADNGPVDQQDPTEGLGGCETNSRVVSLKEEASGSPENSDGEELLSEVVADSVVLKAFKDALHELESASPAVKAQVTQELTKKIKLNALVPEFIPGVAKGSGTSGLNINSAVFKPKVNSETNDSQLNVNVPEFQPTWAQVDPETHTFDLSHSTLPVGEDSMADGSDYDKFEESLGASLNGPEVALPVMLRSNQRTTAVQTGEKIVRLGRDACTGTERIKTHNKKMQVGCTLSGRRTIDTQTETPQREVPHDIYEKVLERAMQAEEHILGLHAQTCFSELVQVHSNVCCKYHQSLLSKSSPQEQRDAAKHFAKTEEYICHEMKRIEALYDSNLSALRDGSELRMLPLIKFNHPPQSVKLTTYPHKVAEDFSGITNVVFSQRSLLHNTSSSPPSAQSSPIGASRGLAGLARSPLDGTRPVGVLQASPISGPQADHRFLGLLPDGTHPIGPPPAGPLGPPPAGPFGPPQAIPFGAPQASPISAPRASHGPVPLSPDGTRPKHSPYYVAADAAGGAGLLGDTAYSYAAPRVPQLVQMSPYHPTYNPLQGFTPMAAPRYPGPSFHVTVPPQVPRSVPVGDTAMFGSMGPPTSLSRGIQQPQNTAIDGHTQLPNSATFGPQQLPDSAGTSSLPVHNHDQDNAAIVLSSAISRELPTLSQNSPVQQVVGAVTNSSFDVSAKCDADLVTSTASSHIEELAKDQVLSVASGVLGPSSVSQPGTAPLTNGLDIERDMSSRTTVDNFQVADLRARLQQQQQFGGDEIYMSDEEESESPNEEEKMVSELSGVQSVEDEQELPRQDTAVVEPAPEPSEAEFDPSKWEAVTETLEPEPSEQGAVMTEPVPEPLEQDADKAELVPEPLEQDADDVDLLPEPLEQDAGKAEPVPEPFEQDADEAEPVPEPLEQDADDVDPLPEPLEQDAGKAEPVPEPLEQDAGKVEPAIDSTDQEPFMPATADTQDVSPRDSAVVDATSLAEASPAEGIHEMEPGVEIPEEQADIDVEGRSHGDEESAADWDAAARKPEIVSFTESPIRAIVTMTSEALNSSPVPTEDDSTSRSVSTPCDSRTSPDGTFDDCDPESYETEENPHKKLRMRNDSVCSELSQDGSSRGTSQSPARKSNKKDKKREKKLAKRKQIKKALPKSINVPDEDDLQEDTVGMNVTSQQRDAPDAKPGHQRISDTAGGPPECFRVTGPPPAQIDVTVAGTADSGATPAMSAAPPSGEVQEVEAGEFMPQVMVMLTQANPMLAQDMANLAFFSVTHMQNMHAMGLIRLRNLDPLIAMVTQTYGITLPPTAAGCDGGVVDPAAFSVAGDVHVPGVGVDSQIPAGTLPAMSNTLGEQKGDTGSQEEQSSFQAVTGALSASSSVVDSSTLPSDADQRNIQMDSGAESKQGLFPKVPAKQAAKTKSSKPKLANSEPKVSQLPKNERNVSNSQLPNSFSQTQQPAAVPSAGLSDHKANQPVPRQVLTVRERMKHITAQKRGEDTGDYQYNYHNSVPLPPSEENWDEEDDFSAPFKWQLPQQGLSAMPPPGSLAATDHPSDSNDWRADMTGEPDPVNVKPTVLLSKPQTTPSKSQKELADFLPAWAREPPKPATPPPVPPQAVVNKASSLPPPAGQMFWSQMAKMRSARQESAQVSRVPAKTASTNGPGRHFGPEYASSMVVLRGEKIDPGATKSSQQGGTRPMDSIDDFAASAAKLRQKQSQLASNLPEGEAEGEWEQVSTGKKKKAAQPTKAAAPSKFDRLSDHLLEIHPQLSSGKDSKHKKNPLYKTQICEFWKAGQCTKKSYDCVYAHGKQELQVKKTAMCHSLKTKGSCPYGAKCIYAHHPKELAAQRPAGKPEKTNMRQTVVGDMSTGASDSQSTPSAATYMWTTSDSQQTTRYPSFGDDGDEGEEHRGDECMICYEVMGAAASLQLDCGHTFHDACIRRWVIGEEATCPACRRHVLLPEEFPQLCAQRH